MQPIVGMKSAFTGGEFAPSLYSRVDVAKYPTGARLLRNMICHPHGGASNRPGFRYIANTKYGNKKARVIPFEFSSQQTYVVELGEYYARFYTNKAQITSSEYLLDNYAKFLMHFDDDPFVEENGKAVTNAEFFDSYTKLFLKGDGGDTTTTITDEIGNTISNPAGNYDSVTKICSDFEGADGATSYSDPVAGAYTFVGTAQLDTAQRKVGASSLLLDGNSDYIYLADSANYDLSNNNFTIEAWIRFAALPSAGAFQAIATFAESGAHWWGLDIYNNSGTYKLRFNVSSSTVSCSADITPSINTWYHVAIVRSGSTWTLYWNGTAVGTPQTSSATIWAMSAVLEVGANVVGTGYGGYFNGWIDMFRLSNGIARWTSNFTPTDLPYGQVYNSIVQKKVGTGSLRFLGDGAYISFPDSSNFDFGSGAFTLDGWFYFTSLTKTYQNIYTQAGTGKHAIQWSYSSGTITFQYSTNGTSYTSKTFSWTPTINTWYHLAVVRSGANLYFFVDGTQTGSTADMSTDTIYNSDATIIIGSDSGDSNLTAYLDNFRISKGLARWTSTFTPPTSAGIVSRSTTVYKLGTGSAYFDGLGSNLSFLNSTDLDPETADFTYEQFVNFETLSDQWLCGNGANTAGGWGLKYDNSAHTLAFYANNASRASVSFTPSASTWYHVAVVRTSGTIKLAIDGVFGSGSTYATSITSIYTFTLGKDSQTSSGYYNGYVDEARFSKGVARWTTDFDPPDSDNLAYEIATPYTEADLKDIKYTQSADVLYLAHKNYAPRELARLANDNWTLSLYDFTNGPFQIANTDDTMTIACSHVSGTSRTLTAVGFTFNALHVGSLWKLRHYIEGQAVTASLTSATSTSSIACGGTWRLITHGTWTATIRIEKSTDGGTSWTCLREFSSVNDYNASTYGTEDMSDDADPFLIRIRCTSFSSGSINVNLTSDPYYQEGVVKVTAVAVGGATATVDVKRNLGLTTATIDWSEGSWSDYRGWPSEVEFHPEDRLVWANCPNEPQTYWMTKSGNYTNFGRSTPLVDSDGISSPVPGRKVNGINGLVPLSEMLALTLSNEASIRSSSGPITPTTAYNKVHGWEGSYGVKPILVGNRCIYVQSTGSIIRDLGYELYSDSFTGADISEFSNHLVNGYTINELAYQQNPDRVIWGVRSDGKMITITYKREQEVVAWTWQDTYNGVDLFESVCSIRGTGYDEVWTEVQRGSIRCIEVLERRLSSTAVEDQFFVDSGITYEGVATTTITGLTHLEGREVSVLADGVYYTKTVASGQITLDVAATTVQVGLQYYSDIETLDIEVNMQDGTAQGRKKKVSMIVFRLLNTLGAKIGPDSDTLYSMNIPVTTPQVLFSGDLRETLAGYFNDGGRIFVRQSSPLPMTITGIMPVITIGGVTQE